MLGAPLRLTREVLLPGAGELRAWDGRVDGDGGSFFVECESHANDAQALERKLRAKQRDDPRAKVIVLVLTRSAHHRALLRDHRESLRDLLPLDAPAILRSIRAGKRPAASGLVML